MNDCFSICSCIQYPHYLLFSTRNTVLVNSLPRLCCRRIVWVCLTILWNWRLKSQDCRVSYVTFFTSIEGWRCIDKKQLFCEIIGHSLKSKLHLTTATIHFFYKKLSNWSSFNPLMPGGNKKVTHTWTNLHLEAAGLFKYVWPFCYHQALKG